MNDKVAKICLAIIAALAIIGAVVVSTYTTSAIASAMIQLASVCVGAIGGVAIQGALTVKAEPLPLASSVPAAETASIELPDPKAVSETSPSV